MHRCLWGIEPGHHVSATGVVVPWDKRVCFRESHCSVSVKGPCQVIGEEIQVEQCMLWNAIPAV